MLVRRMVQGLCGVLLLGVITTSAHGAMLDTRRTTYFTFNYTVQLPGVELAAGTYAFEVANPNGSSNIVRVMSRDRRKVYLTQNTRFVHRPRALTLLATISLGETPAGRPQPVKAWYPQDETIGREFIY